MFINTSLSPDTPAQDLRSSRAADSSPAPAAATAPKTPGPDPAYGRLQGLVPLEEDGVSGITDAAGADQVTEFFRANLPSQYAPALAAQARLSPESVFNLLRV
jgi:hypothetical protein